MAKAFEMYCKKRRKQVTVGYLDKGIFVKDIDADHIRMIGDDCVGIPEAVIQELLDKCVEVQLYFHSVMYKSLFELWLNSEIIKDFGYGLFRYVPLKKMEREFI